MQISTAMFFCIILPAGTVGKEETVKKGGDPIAPFSWFLLLLSDLCVLDLFITMEVCETCFLLFFDTAVIRPGVADRKSVV